MTGIDRLVVLHNESSPNELEAGYASYYKLRRQLIIADDDYNLLNDDNTTFVRKVYESVTSALTTMTDEQDQMVKLFTKKLAAFGRDGDQLCADLSLMVVAEIYKLHDSGDCLFPSQYKVLKPTQEDATMTAIQRFRTTCALLQEHKSYSIDILERGSDTITEFVVAPNGAAKRKVAYKKRRR
jgi:hypothetical protein